MSKTIAIALESVSKIFRQGAFFGSAPPEETRALSDVTLEIRRGEVMALVGPNGSGKSTTLKLVSTMLLPDAGRVLVGGYCTSSNEKQVRRRVGFALASERSFFPRLTALENLEFFAALEDVPRRECRERAESVLAEVGLLETADKQAMKLSSGMYQRLAIARALLKNPEILLLDEPSRSLDAVATERLWGIVRGLSAAGITILLATHNFREVAEVCDRAAILQQGILVDVLAPVFDERQLQCSYLELTASERCWTGVSA